MDLKFMQVTLSDKCSKTKPDVGFYKDLVFTTQKCSLDDFESYTEQGYVLTGNYKDPTFTRNGHYMRDNFVSTQFICIDVDHCALTADEILARMKHEPTFYHTSYSHQLDGTNRYHFYYCFEKPIYGAENYEIVFNKVIEGIEDLYDKRAKSCRRMFNTSNSESPNYEFRYIGAVYPLPEEYTTPTEGTPSHITNTMEHSSIEWTDIQISASFRNDFLLMKRYDFIAKYSTEYPFYYETIIDFQGKPYANVSDIDYYIVNPLKYKYDPGKKKMVRNKVKIGERHNQLFKDAIQFKAANPGITIEGLVLALTHDVFNFYNNSDGEMSNCAILSVAKDVISNTYQPLKSKRRFKVNMAYFAEANMTIQQKVGQARKDFNDERIAAVIENYDLLSKEISINDVVQVLKEHSVIVKKKRLLEFCDRYGIVFPTKQEILRRKVLSIHDSNPDLSSRDIESICLTKGIKVSYKTIQYILKSI